MKRLGLFLLAVVMVGCSGGGGGGTPYVEKGGEDKLAVNHNGTYTTKSYMYATGSVVNTGDADAENVALSFSVKSNGTKVCGLDTLLGTVAAGERKTYSYTIIGCPKIKLSEFSWTYTITWDE